MKMAEWFNREWHRSIDSAKEAYNKEKAKQDAKKPKVVKKTDDFEYFADAVETRKKEDVKKFGVPWEKLSTKKKVLKVFYWIGAFVLMSLVITPIGASIVIILYGVSRVLWNITRAKQETKATTKFNELS